MSGRIERSVYVRALRRLTLLLCISSLLVFTGCSKKVPSDEAADVNENSKRESAVSDAKVEQLVRVEDLILDLTPKLNELAKWLQREKDKPIQPPKWLAQLDFEARADSVDVFEILKHGGNDGLYPSYISTATVPASNAAQDSRNPFHSLQEQLPPWRDVKFGVTFAEFTESENGERFVMHTKLVATSGQKPIYGVKSVQHLTWKPVGKDWILETWQQIGIHVIRSPHPLFESVTREAIPDFETFAETQRSYHEEILRGAMMTGQTEIYDTAYLPFVDPNSTHVLPSVSVVDLDDDGWDDLFISARWGPTQFLRNQGDGTFVDQTDEVGLRFPGVVNCSLFVDFDNDGDKDALIGRALEPAVYLRNENGKFRDVTATHSDLGQRYMVSAVSASDINRDGLVDLYLSTYGAIGDNRTESWEEKFLNAQDRENLRGKQNRGHMWLDYAGPPNVIVMNRGKGVLETVPVDEVVSQWHNSYQTAWADFDSDGDDDLFVCNDFAPPSFLINDTPQGADQPLFRDGTNSAFPGGMTSYSMGVSWADFDVDGDLDLYVSNMYSKAGKRILKQLDSKDERMKFSAAGNFLFENNDGEFLQRAGNGPGDLHVNEVGWSYGGQFADFDNDGYPDLYVPSGYFSAPKAFATQVDL